MEPPNKGHYGDNINSAVMSFVERLFPFQRLKNYKETWQLFGTLTSILCRDRGLLYCVPISEGPQSEVPLYYEKQLIIIESVCN